MSIEYGKLKGDTHIDYRLTLHGTITGTATVSKGGLLELHGTCSKDLVIEPGGSVDLYGTVIRDVYNRGGKLEVYGKIMGRLFEESGETLVHKSASVVERSPTMKLK